MSDTVKRVRDLLVEHDRILGRMQYCVLREDVEALNHVDTAIARYLPWLLGEYDAAVRERDELKAEVARRAEQDRINITLTEEQLRLREWSLGLRDDPPRRQNGGRLCSGSKRAVDAPAEQSRGQNTRRPGRVTRGRSQAALETRTPRASRGAAASATKNSPTTSATSRRPGGPASGCSGSGRRSRR